jgi:hypothetical protein
MRGSVYPATKIALKGIAVIIGGRQFAGRDSHLGLFLYPAAKAVAQLKS